jgi:hypothetical protein
VLKLEWQILTERTEEATGGALATANGQTNMQETRVARRGLHWTPSQKFLECVGYGFKDETSATLKHARPHHPGK